MSGVKKCPLCGVVSINPLEAAHTEDYGAFSSRRETLESALDRELWIKIVSILLAVPAAICFIANMLFQGGSFWSLYVVGGLAVGWMFCVSPFLFKKYFPLLWIVANTLATLGYLYLIEYLSGSHGWFYPLALPIVLGIAILSLVIILLINRGALRELYTAAAVFQALGLLAVLVEQSLHLYLDGALQMVWSWYALVSCTAMAGVMVVIERKLIVKEKLKKRLHF
jgi:hypothetical protein